MNLFWNKNRTPLTVIGFAVMLFLAFQYGVTALNQSVYDKMISIQKLYADSEIRKNSIAKIPSLRMQTEEIGKKSDLLNITISRHDIVHVIETIENLAEETHNTITIESNDANNPSKKKAVATKAPKDGDKNDVYILAEHLPSDSSVAISIKVVGDYNNILHFLQKLESMPYASDILSVVIEKKLIEDKDRSLAQKQGIFELTPSTTSPASSDTQATTGNTQTTPQDVQTQQTQETSRQSDEPQFFMQANLDTIVYISGD